MSSEDTMYEIVGLLTGYFQEGPVFLTDQFGDQAPSLADEITAILEEVFTNDTPFSQMWLEYRQDPVPNEAELIGAIEVLEETMPGLMMRLEGYHAAFVELDREGVTEIVETGVSETNLDLDEVAEIPSETDTLDDDEYRDENTYLTGNTEDRSTSALYIEGLDTSIDPNQSETLENEPDTD